MKASTKLQQLLQQLQSELSKSEQGKKTDPLDCLTVDEIVTHFNSGQLIIWLRSGFREYRKRKLRKNLPKNKHNTANEALKNATPAQLAAIKKKLGIR